MSDILLKTMCHPTNLRAAWRQVRRKHSVPGLDGVSGEEFGRAAERHLKQLRRELLAGGYRPLPLRGTFVLKRGGGWRFVGIPTVRDRIAQRALLNVLTPILEPEFEPCSYAYREGRSIYQALSQVQAWHQAGLHWLVDADIDECFDSINRDLLFACLRQYITEQPILDLIRAWVEAGTVYRGEWLLSPRGIPQGDVISPTLCNVLLDEFDEALLKKRRRLVRYADDFLILASTRQRAEKFLEEARTTLEALDLRLDPQKTRIVSFEQGFKYLGTIFVHDLVLPTVPMERETPHGERQVIYVPGYPQPPRRPQAKLEPPDPLEQAVNRIAAAQATGRRVTTVAAALQRAFRQREEKRQKESDRPRRKI
ncbi:MAG TPA: hypothetical protein EYP85_13490, partial [Armatimonadetes bacterium]|nr:hypothetical protein [Armatimonadota bacterium]